jgi:hypothetical protein
LYFHYWSKNNKNKKEVVIELTRTETQKIIEKDKETLLKAGGDDCLNEKDNIKQLSLNRKLYFTAQFFLPRILFICGGLYIIYYK